MTPFEVISFALLGLVVAVLVIAGLALFWVAGQEKRIIETLALTPCPVCRQPLGRAAIDAGRMRTHEALGHFAEEGDAEPASPEHLLGSWLIECLHCHSAMLYDVEQRTWLKVQHPHRAE